MSNIPLLSLPFEKYDVSQATIDILTNNGISDLMALAALTQQDLLDLKINLSDMQKLQQVCNDHKHIVAAGTSQHFSQIFNIIRLRLKTL